MTTMTAGAVLAGEKVKAFMTAGRAIFTVTKGGARFTYRMRMSKPRFEGDHVVHFLDVLTGPENTTSYTWAGTLFSDGMFKTGRNMTASAPSMVMFRDFLRALGAGTLDSEGFEVLHAGRCGRCGRLLTVPESIEIGIGPECQGRMS